MKKDKNAKKDKKDSKGDHKKASKQDHEEQQPVYKKKEVAPQFTIMKKGQTLE